MYRLICIVSLCMVYVHAQNSIENSIHNMITTERVGYRDVRCAVCKAMVDEVNKMVNKVRPGLKMEIGGYRLDSQGVRVRKEVPYARSEMHMTEVMEVVCKNLENYARGKVKKSGKVIVFPLIMENGQMNPLMGHVDIVQDADLNKSLEFYCNGILEEYEDEILEVYASNEEDVKEKVCVAKTELCPEGELFDEDYFLDPADIDMGAEFPEDEWKEFHRKKREGDEKYKEMLESGQISKDDEDDYDGRDEL